MSKSLVLCATILIFAAGLFPTKAKVLRFNHLTVNDGLAQNGVMGIAEDRYGFMWFGTWNGLCRYDGYDFTIYHPDESDSTSLINNRILQVYADTIGDIWVLFSDAYLLCRYNFEDDNFSRWHPDDVHPDIIDSLHRYRPFVQSVAQTAKYRWQIKAEEMALVQFNRSDSSTHHYLPDPLNPWSISYDLLTELYLDSREVLWVGTISRGLNVADTRQKPIVNIGRKFDIDFPSEIRAIATDSRGHLWVGTREDGFYAIDRETNTIEHYKFEDGRAGDENSDQIRKIYQDRFGLIWIGTKGGLRSYNPETKQFRHYQLRSTSWIPNNWVFEIMEDYKGDLWIGTFWGISRYIREEDRFQPLSNDMPLSSVRVRDIIEDKYRNLWVATEAGGLTLLKRGVNQAGEEQFVPEFYWHDPLNEETISSNYAYCMDQDEKGFIWIGTPNGLNRLNPSTGTFKRYGEAEGLPDRKIVGVVCDSAGSVWVSHKKGLSRIHLANNTISSYDYFDGLQGNEFSQNAGYRDPESGELFFGGVYGLNSFFTSDLEKNPYPPIVYLSGLEIMNQKIGVGQRWNKRVILKKPLYLTDSITLAYDDRTLTLDFVGLHFSNPPANQYRYMLEGFDRDWIYVDAKKRSAAYSNLPAGIYLFKVMAANPDGLWSPQPATLTLQILPPWWKTQWAYGLYFILLFLVFYWIYRTIELRIIYRQEVTYERLKASKLEEFNASEKSFSRKWPTKYERPSRSSLAHWRTFCKKNGTCPKGRSRCK
ncbi:ligand-binding sensor domain-containing protein [Geofilum rubicundum]|uniref:DNA-binding response regulator, AraC family n=1 Tax=Geofilum rubicundum JCM 15548 TaxID=1236989 RepID=A0A0E9LSS6_9BACT|nr:two-component regulator propeller domain-containing protein [Geofilum rubicundum]GAO28314.1 DNA-binding response regulator, AraC family [Geofilum rubicundum JCM 15548]